MLAKMESVEKRKTPWRNFLIGSCMNVMQGKSHTEYSLCLITACLTRFSNNAGTADGSH